MQIGFVCTNYNNSSYTSRAVDSLCKADHQSQVRIVVVDNHSRDDAVLVLRQIARAYPGVDLLLNQENVGYFGGLNIGLQHLQRKWPGIKYVVVGNNDLLFPKDFVENFQRYRDILDTWAVVAPDIVTVDGLHQNPHVSKSISRLRRIIWDFFYLSYGTAALVKKLAKFTKNFTGREETRPGNELYRTPGPIVLGLGACYMLGPMFFKHFARLYAPTFLMNEEFFLAAQVRAIGQSVYYDPRFVVTHCDHATTDLLPSREYWKISRDAHRVYKRHLAMSAEELHTLITHQSREHS